MADKFHDDTMLDDLFATAAADPRGAPSADLMARVLQDAETLQASEGFQADASARREGFWAGVLSMLGGWPSLGGVAMAGVAGVWIGVAAGPSVMQGDLASNLIFSSADAYLTDLDDSFAIGLLDEE